MQKFPKPRISSLRLLALVLLIVLLIPIGVLLRYIPNVQALADIPAPVLEDYIFNSLALVVGVGLGSLCLGVATAWLVSTKQFFGRRILEIMLVLPLAIPSYIIAFTYSGILDYTGVVQVFTRHQLGWKSDALVPFEIRSLGGAILVLSLVLYPYVYVVARTAFRSMSQSVMDAARLQEGNAWRRWWRIHLPMARPAIIGGVTLVIMEVLNDYGAVKYYGVPTFTTGIFSTWFSMDQRDSAIGLALLLLVFVFALVQFERWQGRRLRFSSERNRQPLRRQAVGRPWQVLFFILCSLPLLLGFLVPAAQLLAWTLERSSLSLDEAFWGSLWNSLRVAFYTALCATFVAFILQASLRRDNRFLRMGARLASMGYAIPGAVIAIGVMIPSLFVDKVVFEKLTLLGGIFALTYALLVRFLAVAYQSVQAGFGRMGQHIEEAARSLGASPWRVLRSIQLPLLRRNLLAAVLLVLIDVLKELPLTLILRPFNFDTLATKTFELADDEMLAEASVYALIIVAVGLIPVLWLQRLDK